LCAAILRKRIPSADASQAESRLVWRLPSVHAGHTTRGSSYLSTLLSLIETAKSELVIVSPFIDETGVGRLTGPLMTAMRRNVNLILLTVNATNIASFYKPSD